jgi:hypothetical protein
MIGENGFERMVWFMGIVARVDDPYNGRVRIRAFGFHPPATDASVAIEDLPLAHMVRDSKLTTLPDEGDLVLGFFIDGRDAQHPIILGVINSAKFGLPAAAGISNRYTGGDASLTNRAINTDLSVQARAFLDATALKESGGDYWIRNGGGRIVPNTPHPGTIGPGGTSTATGRYQFTYDTWLELNGGVNAPMTPENQDAAAWALAQQRYQAYGLGSSGYPTLDSYLSSNGMTAELLNGLAPTWAAFSENQTAIIGAYDSSLSSSGLFDSPSINEQGLNPYLSPSPSVIQNYGNPAMPVQFHGEGIDQTPYLTQAVTTRTATAGAYSVSEPSVPLTGTTDTSVWRASYNGSFIELSGRNTSEEFINLTHASGSHILLDRNGNVSIKAIGKLYQGSEADSQEYVEGVKISIYNGGYALHVANGRLDIESMGDMNITARGDLNITTGGRLRINAGDAIDIAGSRIAMTSRVDAIDLLSVGKLALQSQGGSVFVRAGESVGIQSTSAINLKASSNINLGGSQIHLNSPDSEATDSEAAVAADVPSAIPRGVSSEMQFIDSPSSIGPDMTDDTSDVGVLI